MKTRIALPLSFMAFVPFALAALPDTVNYQSPKADITFVHPDKFKDIKDSYMPSEKGQKGLLDIFGKFVVSVADDLIPNGCKLTMTFTDVDFAGDFEPWHGPQSDDIRIVKDIYPPDYKFSWKVTDASGRVLREGTENLRDIDFQMNRSLADDFGPIQSDKDEIRDWMHRHLRHLK